MKVEKRSTKKRDWAKVGEDLNAGDLVKILDEGEVDTGGSYGDRNVFMLLTKNGEKAQGFNQTSMNYLIDAFGDDTEKWVDKKIKVWVVEQMIEGKLKDVVYLTASDWVKQDGKFCSPGGKKEEVETIEQD